MASKLETTLDAAGASRAVLLALVSVVAALVLFRTPYAASDLDPYPDAVEYAVGAQRIARLGRFDLPIEGRALPPRYPPWFSLLMAPLYLSPEADVASGVYVVFALGVAGVAAAAAIGLALGGPWSAALAGLAVLALPIFRWLGVRVMSDVPACALILLGALVYLRVVRGGAPARRYLLAGLIVALGAALRVTTLALLLPFLRAAWLERRGRAARLAGLLTPSLLVLAATAVYNQRVFGSPWRDGYHFWAPATYDYARMTFSSSYIPDNARAFLGRAGFGVAALAAAAALRLSGRDRSWARPLLEFGLLGTGPIVLFHLLYYFPEARFFMSPAALAAVLAGAALGRVLKDWPRALVPAALAMIALNAAVFRARVPGAAPRYRERAELLARRLPADAVLISQFDPVYLEPLLLRGTRRSAVPISRAVEYACKLVAWRKVADPRPAPTGPYDHRCAGLASGGAEEAVRYVAAEQLGDLERKVAAGAPVFLDAYQIAPSDTGLIAELGRRFKLEPFDQALYRLGTRHGG